MHRQQSNTVFLWLLTVSGFCGISYEILYSRVLGNLIGDQMIVSASILMTFLLGIGIGTLFAYRLWRFLWLIEAIIGVCGLVFAFSTDYLNGLIFNLSGVIGTSIYASVAICAFLLIVPAFCIGCSLPLFAGYLSRLTDQTVFSKAYMLYNFGAALTALMIEFYLVRKLGIAFTLVSIAALNFFIAILQSLKLRLRIY